MSNTNNGMITKIWGPSLWRSLEAICFGYPVEPSEENKKKFHDWLILLGDVLPCKYCRDSYKIFISSGVTKLNEDVFKNRDSLTEWLYLLHEEVNKKLGVTYGITYGIMVKRNESFRASCSTNTNEKGCIMPLDMKARSYRMAEVRDAPLIPYDVALLFEPYAHKRGLVEKDMSVLKLCTDETCIHEKIGDLDCNEWCKRNEDCWIIINDMRQNGLPAIETEGEWIDLPTIHELRLIMQLSTTLSFDVLNSMIPKLNKLVGGNRKTYYLTK
jgi:hypothetical protein